MEMTTVGSTNMPYSCLPTYPTRTVPTDLRVLRALPHTALPWSQPSNDLYSSSSTHACLFTPIISVSV